MNGYFGRVQNRCSVCINLNRWVCLKWGIPITLLFINLGITVIHHSVLANPIFLQLHMEPKDSAMIVVVGSNIICNSLPVECDRLRGL